MTDRPVIPDQPTAAADVTDSRRALMRLCALASDAELAAAVAAFKPAPEVTDVRAAEVGLVMVQGRAGGDGAPFNLGEATVTRAVVAVSGGATGFAYLLGRRMEAARDAAVLDALAQVPDARATLDAAFVAPVAARLAAEAAAREADTDRTRVKFFTLERGESPS
jgi:alpha-D-ribose 1-methylphosphonate 5-triphosphate synthase subunit PhnG